MPEFRLELPERPNDRTNWRMLHSKMQYNLPVKMVDWDQLRDTKPFDSDPYCPGKVNLFKSHYKNFGFQDNEPYITETMHMLSQRFKPDNYSSIKMKKSMLSYMSYKDWLPCETKNDFCLSRCVSDYSTTAQNSYTPPYPYVMNRISFPAIPHLKYRRMKFERPDLSDDTFYDEDFPRKTKILQEHKVHRFKSYNPCTDLYSDGTEIPEKKQYYYELEYRKH